MLDAITWHPQVCPAYLSLSAASFSYETGGRTQISRAVCHATASKNETGMALMLPVRSKDSHSYLAPQDITHQVAKYRWWCVCALHTPISLTPRAPSCPCLSSPSRNPSSYYVLLPPPQLLSSRCPLTVLPPPPPPPSLSFPTRPLRSGAPLCGNYPCRFPPVSSLLVHFCRPAPPYPLPLPSWPPIYGL